MSNNLNDTDKKGLTILSSNAPSSSRNTTTSQQSSQKTQKSIQSQSTLPNPAK